MMNSRPGVWGMLVFVLFFGFCFQLAFSLYLFVQLLRRQPQPQLWPQPLPQPRHQPRRPLWLPVPLRKPLRGPPTQKRPRGCWLRRGGWPESRGRRRRERRGRRKSSKGNRGTLLGTPSRHLGLSLQSEVVVVLKVNLNKLLQNYSHLLFLWWLSNFLSHIFFLQWQYNKIDGERFEEKNHASSDQISKSVYILIHPFQSLNSVWVYTHAYIDTHIFMIVTTVEVQLYSLRFSFNLTSRSSPCFLIILLF